MCDFIALSITFQFICQNSGFFNGWGESMCSLKNNIFNILAEFYVIKLLFHNENYYETENKPMKSCGEERVNALEAQFYED